MSNWAKLQEDTIQLPIFKRARHGIHFDKGNGEILANFSGKPCHFQDTDGLWKPIDTKLLPLGDGYYGCPHSKVKVKPDGTVKIAGTDYVQYTQLPSGQTGLVDNDKLVRKFSFGEQRMWVTENGFKSEIQLNRIPTLTEARKLIATESGTLSKEYLKSLTTATDANGDVHTYSTLTAFRTWLAKATFPVVIDPDFAGSTADGYIYGLNADYATARSTSLGNNSAFADMSVGQYETGGNIYIFRNYVLFDTSSITGSGTVTQVNLKLLASANASGTDFDLQIVKFDWAGTWGSGTNQEDDYDGCLSADADDSIWRNTNGMSIYTQYTSGNLSTAWIKKTGTTKYGLRSSLDASGTDTNNNSYITLQTSNSTTESYRPVLTVTYTAGGATYVPTINMRGQMQDLTGLRG